MCIFLLAACGLSGDRNGTGGQSFNDNGSGSNNDNDDPFAIKEKIGVRVERINGEINDVNTNDITIVTLDENFVEIASNVIPSYQVEPRLSGGFEFQFSTSYIERVNQVIKVTFDRTTTPPEILYAPLYKVESDTESIIVSSKSHYVLKKLFDTIPSRNELNQLIPCTSTTVTCPNQAMAKSNMLEQITIAANAYNIDIDETFSVSQAMNLLDSRTDLRQSIETATNEISRDISPFSKGTRRSFTFGTDGQVVSNLTIPVTYNSIMFGLSLSTITPNDSNRSIKVSGISSTIAETESNIPAYPRLNQTTSLLDMRRDVISSDIPFERTNLVIAQNNTFTLDDNEALNSLASSGLADSFLSTQGFLLNERIFQQTTPSNIGWEFSPYFSKNYQVNEYEYPTSTSLTPSTPDYGSAPTWLVSANYSKAASFELSGSGNNLVREEQFEDSHLFSWEVHSLEVDKDENFSVSAMNNKTYGVLSYSLKLNDQNNSNVMQVIADTAEWQINSGTISITQPNSDQYKTLTLSRNDNNQTQGVMNESNPINSQLAIATVATQISNDTAQNQGLIKLEGSGSDEPLGHATQNGKYLSLVFNTRGSDPLFKGQGIILASELGNPKAFSGETYQLQGNSFEINDEENILHNLNGSSLSINDRLTTDPFDVQCHATLTINKTSITHTVGTQENTLSTPVESSIPDITSQTCKLEDSAIELNFALSSGKTLTLRGFIVQKNDTSSTEPGNLINLIWEQDNQLGLVFASKEQDLSPTFSD